MAKSFELENLFRMTNPADFAGAVNFAKDPSTPPTVAQQILDITLNTNANGVLSSAGLKSALEQFVTNGSGTSQALNDQQKEQLFKLLRFYSTAGKLNVTSEQVDKSHKSVSADGKSTQDIKNLKEVINPLEIGEKPATIIMSDSPFINPVSRNIEKVEVFMNGIPSYVLARCVPYLDAEFQFDRRADPRLQTPGLLKFLLGTGEGDLNKGPNKAMADAHRRPSPSGKDSELTFAGMEMFTAPQTLVNPSPVANGNRYVPIIDPFKPFMTLDGVEISVVPTVGMYAYKKAKMTLKLHDRSRLSEISDLVKPEVYTRTTVWLTYGWRHPDEPNNPYATFINDNMMMREAYGIINSSFSFEPTGGVALTIELFTKSISEMQTVKVDESPSSSTSLVRQVTQLRQDIARLRLAKGLDTGAGSSREIRPLQILDAAERGELPDMSKNEIRKNLAVLISAISKPDPNVDPDLQRDLVKNLNEIYGPGKPGFFERLKSSVAAAVNEKFSAAMTGLDPFLPSNEKDSSNPLADLVEKFNPKPQGGAKKHTRRMVSLGKIFSTFVLPAMATTDAVDDIQIFFYAFNDSAGPASGTNIGEFPIEMSLFLDQWREHVTKRGSEKITIEEFLRVLVDAHVNDPRTMSYGIRTRLEPYGPDIDWRPKKGQEQRVESMEADLLSRFGVFKKPAIEMYIETLPERSTAFVKAVDITRSASNGAVGGATTDGRKRIMRIHVYDKQAHPYKTAELLLKSDDGDDKFYIAGKDFSKRAAGLVEKARADAANKQTSDQITRKAAQDLQGNDTPIDLSTNAAIKQAVARIVPTIIYGSNATAVINATLSSQQEPLLATVQMLNAGKQNTTTPNGAGAGGIPLRVIPTMMQMTTYGCPLMNLAQLYFVDFNTGTTADNLYIVSHIVHSFAPGKFESNMNMTFADAYGRYEGAQSVFKSMQQFVDGQQDTAKR